MRVGPPSAAIPAVALVAAGLCLVAGLGLLGQGLWIPIKAQVAQVLLTRAWAATLDGRPMPPWPWADTVPVARLILPDSAYVVLAGGSGQALAFAPGHLSQTPLPGEPGLSVIAAHRDTHFAGLGKLAPGQRITVRRSDGSDYRFRISQGRIMDARGQGLSVRNGPPRLALVTCWPLNGAVSGGPGRFVLFADLEPTSDQHRTNIKPTSNQHQIGRI